MFADMEVTYEDHMGSDLKVVNAARVSFGKRSDWAGMEYLKKDDGYRLSRHVLKLGDENLIAFLARGCRSGEWEDMLLELSGADWVGMQNILHHVKRMHTHWTPFAHCSVTLIFKVPLFVARQLGKHQVGFVWSEESRRYVDKEPVFYVPEVWRKRAEDIKQGSAFEMIDMGASFRIEDYHQSTRDVYVNMLKQDVCPEQARMILPQNTMVNFWLTGSLYGWANLYNQRSDPHAQKETQIIADMVGKIIEPLYPVSWKHLTE